MRLCVRVCELLCVNVGTLRASVCLLCVCVCPCASVTIQIAEFNMAAHSAGVLVPVGVSLDLRWRCGGVSGRLRSERVSITTVAHPLCSVGRRVLNRNTSAVQEAGVKMEK